MKFPHALVEDKGRRGIFYLSQLVWKKLEREATLSGRIPIFRVHIQNCVCDAAVFLRPHDWAELSGEALPTLTWDFKKKKSIRVDADMLCFIQRHHRVSYKFSGSALIALPWPDFEEINNQYVEENYRV